MALGNIFVEPRREITESVVGVLVVGGFIYADFSLSCYYAYKLAGPGDPMWLVIGLLMVVFGLIVPIISIGLLAFTHFVGEEICESLEINGLYLRPRQRYLRNMR